MTQYIIRRVLMGLLTVYFIITLIFFALRLIPGDPVEVWLGDYATPQLIEITRARWGLDQPIWSQYTMYLRNLFQGDLGESLRMGVPVSYLIGRSFPYTARLMTCGIFLAVLVSVPIGILAASRQNSLLDMFVMISSFFFISMPAFWLGLMVLFTFSFRLGWFPSIGGETGDNIITYLSYLVLPSICVGFRYAGVISRMVRSTIIDILSMDYIRVARSKGLDERVVLYKHALRNALAPIISLVGVCIVLALAGAVVLEIVYSRPGLGRLYVGAVRERDFPIIQGFIMVIAIIVVTVNLLVDICYGIIDPRIRYE